MLGFRDKKRWVLKWLRVYYIFFVCLFVCLFVCFVLFVLFLLDIFFTYISNIIPFPSFPSENHLSSHPTFFKWSSGCFSFSMNFSFLARFHFLQWTFLNFPPFSVFLAIFHVRKCVFLIFRDFQVSHHIPGPTVCISHFSLFSVI